MCVLCVYVCVYVCVITVSAYSMLRSCINSYHISRTFNLRLTILIFERFCINPYIFETNYNTPNVTDS